MMTQVVPIWSVDFKPVDTWERNQNRDQLEENLLARPSRTALAQNGILDDSDLAPALHGVASRLNKNLANRTSIIDLQNKHILIPMVCFLFVCILYAYFGEII